MPSRVPKLLLIDSNALIHRAFHALPPLTSPKGEMVNAVYGFASALLKAIKDERPDYVVACMDAGRQTFRNDIYKEYKANRKETDEALYLQIPRVKELVEALGIPLFAQQGVEADDLIGSLAKIAAKKGLRTVIVTGDNDTLQLVDDSTAVYGLSRGVNDTLLYDSEKVVEKIGLKPNQVVDYKALAGDSSDNIPGVPGFGPKTAVDLLNKYKTIEGIYDHLEELPERQRKLLTEHKELMAVSRRLGQIKTDLEIDLNLKEAAAENFDFSRAVGFFQEFGFKSLLSRLPSTQPKIQSHLFAEAPTPPKLPANQGNLPYKIIRTTEEWHKLYKTLKTQEELAVDTETIDLEGELIGVSFAWSDQDCAYLPLSPAYQGGVELEEIKKELSEILANEKIHKIGHNLKYDVHALKRAELDLNGVWFDTMIAANLLASRPTSMRLDDLSIAELGFRKISISELIGPTKKEPMNKVDLELLGRYACEDALITWRLFKKYWPQMEEKSLKRIFYEIEMSLLPVLCKMERLGITIDLEHLKQLSTKLTERLSELQKDIIKAAGTEFNVNSPLQLKEVLFNRLKLSTAGIKKTKTGLSTDAESLTRLKDAHPVINLILEQRELSKLVSTYIDTLPQQMDENGRVHTTYQQLGAATGRLSSTNPNLQNIPIRTELGTEVRRAFIAQKGWTLLGVDYSQIELRIVAHISGDENMIKVFTTGGDIHQAVAERLGVNRRTAKAINFGIIYGLGPNALANDLGLTAGEAREIIDRYLDEYPGIRGYMDEMRNFARTNGYVETVLGRRRYLPDIHSPNMGLRAAAERMAINMPAQGTNADLMKLAMVEVDRQLPGSARMLLTIHDELMFEVQPTAVKEISELVRKVMTSVAELKVPLAVEVKVGSNWAELEPLK